MGGLGFVAVIAFLGFLFLPDQFHPLLLLFLGFGAIGFLDDFLKILRKKNEGLTFWQKIILQIIFASVFSFFVPETFNLFYFLFCLFIIVGGANAANLTDGLDGLLSGSAIIGFAAFGYILTMQGFMEGALFAFIVAGALLGFLPYNFPKARVFMGDVGSLPLGAVLAGLAILTGNELLLIPISALFIIEALSVIIQVASFKFFKKRVFKMSPLHHHFEILGWSEKRVVFLFWEIELIFCLVGVLIVAL